MNLRGSREDRPPQRVLRPISPSYNENQVLREMVSVCQTLHAKNMLAAGDGNASFRFADHRIMITPSGYNKALIGTADMAVIDVHNRIISGRPSSERFLHTEIYRSCPQARCVVHAHPPHAVAWTIAHPEMRELPGNVLPEVIYGVGSIPIVPYARPGTDALAENVRAFLPQRALILARHGAVSWGETVTEALNGMERIEHTAQMLKLAHDLGGLSPLDEKEIAALRELRAQLGDRNL